MQAAQRRYLKCGMERELMAEQPLEELGFSNKAEAVKGKNEKKAERREGPSKSEGSWVECDTQVEEPGRSSGWNPFTKLAA